MNRRQSLGGGARGFIPLKGKILTHLHIDQNNVIMNNRFSKCEVNMKKGFTLAEVLITLGIIGVVAAMTMPTLIGKYKERETITKLKKINSVMNQAFYMAVKDHGSPELWGWSASIFSEEDDAKEQTDKGKNVFIDKIAPYLKTTSICRFGESCRNNSKYKRDVYSLDGTPKRGDNFFGTPAIMLADGSTIEDFWVSSNDCSYNYGESKPLHNAVCAEIWVDINGVKKPNVIGKDIFWFFMSRYGIYPGGLQDQGDYFAQRCNLAHPGDGNGYACAAWVIYNENMDYLRCNDLSWNGKRKCSE